MFNVESGNFAAVRKTKKEWITLESWYTNLEQTPLKCLWY